MDAVTCLMPCIKADPAYHDSAHIHDDLVRICNHPSSFANLKRVLLSSAVPKPVNLPLSCVQSVGIPISEPPNDLSCFS